METTRLEAIIDQLQAAKRQGDLLYSTLRNQGADEQAEEVRARTRTLQREIDRLLARAMEDWLSDAEAMRERMDQANEELQDAVDSIQNDVATAGKVVRALGYLDDVITVASRILA